MTAFKHFIKKTIGMSACTIDYPVPWSLWFNGRLCKRKWI